MSLAVTSAPWQNVNMPALDLRRYLGAGYQEGVVGSGDMAVAQRAAGANYSVDIAAGEALVQGDAVTNQGRYYAYNDAVVNLTGFTAAHATLPRIDRVTLRVRDTFHDGSGSNDVSFQIVTGTATSGATLVNLNGAAAVPTNQLLLANILIPATATTITTANIDTTVRTRALSVLLSQLGQSGATTGQYAQWNGTAWVPVTLATTTQLDYAQQTSNQTSTATSAATATAVVTGNAVAYDGSSVLVKFFCPSITNSVANQIANFNLYDGSTDLGQICKTWSTTTGGGNMIAIGETVITPSAATHTYSIRAWNSAAGTVTCVCGAGGAGVDRPMFMRITRAA